MHAGRWVRSREHHQATEMFLCNVLVIKLLNAIQESIFRLAKTSLSPFFEGI